MSDLKLALYDAVAICAPESNVGVAFSGGVDSSLLAKICKDLGKQVTLLTIGFPGSHDIKFAKVIASQMGMEHRIFEIDHEDFQQNLTRVMQIIKCKNTSHIENCVAYYYICKLAISNGLNTILSANGCDELFCGYDAYRMAYAGGEEAVMKLMEEKIVNELDLVSEISEIAIQLEVEVRQPFLSAKFANFAMTIPVAQKIYGADDMKRKHVLRETALSIGVPEESANMPKKALQYGSLIHKHFKKVT